jgi:Uma2 family endonuclease
MILQKARYAPEDLLTMPDGDRYELVDGQLVERPMSFWSSYVAGVLIQKLRNFSDTSHPGWVQPEGTTYQCFPHKPEMVRKADVSFIQLARVSLADATKEGHIKIPPDLAVEVVSPSDVAYDLDEKISDYLRAGVRLVWVIHPLIRTVQIHRLDGSVGQLSAQEEVNGEDVLPGFRCRVADLFVPPGAPATRE